MKEKTLGFRIWITLLFSSMVCAVVGIIMGFITYPDIKSISFGLFIGGMVGTLLLMTPIWQHPPD